MENTNYYASYLNNRKALLEAFGVADFQRDFHELSKSNNIAKKFLKELKTSSRGSLIFNEGDFSRSEITSLEGMIFLPYIKKIDLSGNKIQNICSEFYQLQNIRHLDLSSNKIVFLDGNITKLNIVSLFVSNNQLKTFPDLAGFSKLQLLDLSQNNLSEIKNSRPNNVLRKLNISDNPLVAASDTIEPFLEISEILMNNCQFKNCSTIKAFFKAQYFSMHNSGAGNLQSFSEFKSLISLGLGYNHIKNVHELEWLLPNQSLALLDLAGNELQKSKFYTEAIINMFPGLTHLDGNLISQYQRYQAKNLYGLYNYAKEELYSKWLPQEDFIDYRFYAQDQIDIEEDEY